MSGSRRLALLSIGLAWLLAAAAPAARADGGSGGGEGHGGDDIEADFGLRAQEVADYFSAHPEAGGEMNSALALEDWKLFAVTAKTTRVVPIDHKPQCLHQDGMVTPRDACFYKASPGVTAHIDVFAAGFAHLSPAHQRRLVAHETFRALGQDASDESYELSNAIFVAMPDAAGTGEAPLSGSVGPLLASGTYRSPGYACGIKLYRSQAGAGKTVLNATLVQIGDGVGNFCPARGVSTVARCGPVSCEVDFTMSHPVTICVQARPSDGACLMSEIKYEGDHYSYWLTPLDSGTLNVLGTLTPAHGEADQIVKNQVFGVMGLNR